MPPRYASSRKVPASTRWRFATVIFLILFCSPTHRFRSFNNTTVAASLWLGEAGNLIIGAQPSHRARLFLRGAFGIERDKAGDDFGRGQIGGPSVSGGNGGVDVIMQLCHDTGAGTDCPIIGGKVQRRAVTFQITQIVNLGHGKAGGFGKRGLARVLQFLCQGGDGGPLRRGGIGEGERVKAKRLIVTWPIL
jgi:hypothetical protein